MADAEINLTGSLRLEYIADIEFGPAVMESHFWLFLATVMLIVILVTAIWRRYTCQSSRSLRALKQLRRQYARGEIENRQVVFELAALMRRAASVSRLSAEMPLPDIEPERWQWFHERLAAARYSREGISQEETARLIEEGRLWMRLWR
jgi:hypothetical protein